jgi:hypothetical protein
MNSEKEENFIHELMGKSGAKMPFTDFEDKLMHQIHKEADTSRSFQKNVKLSWFFFTVGTLFGLFLNMIVGEMNKTIFGLPAHRFVMIVQSIFVILLLLQFDKLIELTKTGFNRDKNPEM